MKRNGRTRRFRRIPRRPRRQFLSLHHYLIASGDTQANTAIAVFTSQALISRIANGLTVPRADLAARLVTYAHIPFDSFVKSYIARKRYGAAWWTRLQRGRRVA